MAAPQLLSAARAAGEADGRLHVGTAHDVALMASALRGIWRRDPPPLTLTPAELERITPILAESDVAALVWRRVEVRALEPSALAAAARRTRLETFVRDESLTRVLRLLHDGGIETVLLKGAATARHYAVPDARPRGDIDLLVDPEDEPVAEQLLAEQGHVEIDLQTDIPDRLWPLGDIARRAISLTLMGMTARTLAPEDELAQLCLHFLKHGGYRPLWLCDVAAAVEDRRGQFDWSRCLGPDPRRARWVLCTLGLASTLLGAELPREEIESTPVARARRGADPFIGPAWLRRTVLRAWRAPYAVAHPPLVYGEPMSEILKRPAGLPRALLRRWPDPVIATVAVGASFNRVPRFPFQLQHAVQRTAAALKGDRK